MTARRLTWLALLCCAPLAADMLPPPIEFRSDLVDPIPEPASILLLGVAALLLARRMRMTR